MQSGNSECHLLAATVAGRALKSLGSSSDISTNSYPRRMAAGWVHAGVRLRLLHMMHVRPFLACILLELLEKLLLLWLASTGIYGCVNAVRSLQAMLALQRSPRCQGLPVAWGPRIHPSVMGSCCCRSL